ncbi:AvrD family protein [Rhodococcus koreensis]|uniref:Avirulence D protein (AvrD) n=1 Tax=Rhodococcus koreensis TaxID=99653 RepID=A0A1H4M3W5_9NOCA|nr:AvrD family protein [Rhodococcus koreensis]SEB77195.1 avirulence D protein (AvrD) [Rhodococcus koreensis]
MNGSHFQSYDHALGPRNGRYFGCGYKRVEHSLSDISIERSMEVGARYSAAATLRYPSDWSKKSSKELVPHVSSIDTLVLAATICELAIVYTRDLNDTEAGQIWVRRATVRCGTRPHEDLQNIPVEAVVEGVTEDEPDANTVQTSFSFQVGELKGTLVLVHPPGSGPLAVPGVDRFRSSHHVHRGPGKHFYLDGFKDRTLSGRDIVVSADNTSITGQHRIDHEASGQYYGAESGYPGSISLIDMMLGAAQLAQILLYTADSLDRSNSNTLWMRKLELTAESPIRPTDGDFAGTAEIRRSNVVERAGHRWRSVEIAGREFQGVTGSFLLCHQLPARRERAAHE